MNTEMEEMKRKKTSGKPFRLMQNAYKQHKNVYHIGDNSNRRNRRISVCVECSVLYFLPYRSDRIESPHPILWLASEKERAAAVVSFLCVCFSKTSIYVHIFSTYNIIHGWKTPSIWSQIESCTVSSYSVLVEHFVELDVHTTNVPQVQTQNSFKYFRLFDFFFFDILFISFHNV